jgi:triacylglycerol lipase
VTPAPPRPGPRSLWWRLLDYEVAVRWIVTGVVQPGDPDELAGSPESTRGRPVVIVPGVYEAWHFMRPLARSLHARGLSVHVVPGLGRNRSGIAPSATLLRERIAALGLHDVVLVAHSKGGLIGKRAMIDDVLARERRIGSMVTVNTPFTGSRYARWVPLPAVRALVPGAPSIQELALERSVDERIVAVRSFWDPHVPDAGPPGDGADVLLTTPGHFRPLVDAELLEIVVRHSLVDSGPSGRS